VRTALWADAQREIELALKAALLLEHDVPRGEVAERLGISAEEARAAIKRGQWAREQVGREGPGASASYPVSSTRQSASEYGTWCSSANAITCALSAAAAGSTAAVGSSGAGSDTAVSAAS
jgi:hypothetical protein